MVQGQSVMQYDVVHIYKKGHYWNAKIYYRNPNWNSDDKKLVNRRLDKALSFCMKMNYQFLLSNNVTIIQTSVKHSNEYPTYTYCYFINNKYVGELTTPTPILQPFHLCKIIKTLTQKGLI